MGRLYSFKITIKSEMRLFTTKSVRERDLMVDLLDSTHTEYRLDEYRSRIVLERI